MSEDKLRDFIRENRSQFDTERAPERVWDRIEKDMGRGPKGNSLSYTTVIFLVLTVLILFTGGLFMGSKYFGAQNEDVMYAQIDDQEFQEMNHFYQARLESTEQKFVQTVNEKSVLEEVESLDKGYQELLKDFKNSSEENKELILSLIKENYELRIKIIELAMDRIQQDSMSVSKYKNYEYQEY